MNQNELLHELKAVQQFVMNKNKKCKYEEDSIDDNVYALQLPGKKRRFFFINLKT